MRKFSFMILLIWAPLYSQLKGDEFIMNEVLQNEVQTSSSSSFMQYSGFIPSTFKEILISVSGNDFVDSLLIKTGTDTLILLGANIFDAHIRKDFALESVQSPTLNLFFKYRIYDKRIVKTAIVYFYSKFLKGESVSIQEMKKKCLKGNRFQNEKARRKLVKQARNSNL